MKTNDMIEFAGNKVSKSTFPVSLQPIYLFIYLLWQQDRPTDHQPDERGFNANAGDFMSLPSAALRISGVLLEMVLENERKNKVCAKYLDETGAYCSP